MPSLSSTAAALAPLAALAAATSTQSAFCPPWWLYNNDNGPSISYSTIKLTVPDAPPQLSGGQGPYYVWPGVSNPTDGLDQPILSYNGPCGTGQWCVFAADCQGCGAQQGGGAFDTSATAPVATGDVLTFQFTVDGSGTHQSVLRDNQVLVSLDTPGTANTEYQLRPEVYLDDAFTPPQITWTDLVLGFQSANPDAAASLFTQNLQASEFASADGGNTWTVASIAFDQSQCDPNATIN